MVFNMTKDILIVGGEDHRTGQEARPEKHYEELERWTRERFPMVSSIAYRWSGQVIETIDGLAFIGKNPGDSQPIYICTGDSGMGMTHGAGRRALLLATPAIVAAEFSVGVVVMVPGSWGWRV